MLLSTLEEKINLKQHSQSPKIKIQTHSDNILIKKEKKEVLKVIQKDNSRGQMIGKLATGYYYTFNDTMIKDLAQELNKNPEILSLAVVDKELKPLGVIIRKELFDMLGKPFGKEVFENKMAERFLIKVPVFDKERNILSILDELDRKMSRHKTERYLLQNKDGKFNGIFTNIDLLSYLSEITQTDIKLAKQLQTSIVKENYSLYESHFNLFAVSRMAKGVGGDFYTSLQYHPNHWVLSICDVSGKGVAAALVTAILGGVVSMYDFKDGLAHFIKKLNHYIFESFNTEKYLTGIFMKMDARTGKITLFDMGHSYLYLYRNNMMYKMKSDVKNFPIGITLELDPQSSHISLIPGDILIACTDGIPEQTNEAGEEYGISKIASYIRKHLPRGLEKMGRDLFDNIQHYKGKEPLRDDMTLLILQYKGSQ